MSIFGTKDLAHILAPELKRSLASEIGLMWSLLQSLRTFALAALAATVASPFANAVAQTPSGVEKMNAYVGCLNRLSEAGYDSRARYFSWAAKSGPTGKERIIYGTYTIYDTAECRKNIEKANSLLPQEPALEAAASVYADAVGKLETLLKEAVDYYGQENYKDDNMAKGKALHPRLVAAWDAFENADTALRAGVEAINDRFALEKLAEIEKSEGKSARYQVDALMINAKRVLRAADREKPDPAEMIAAINELETTIREVERMSGSGANARISGMFVSSAKSYLTTSKQLMRRIRDKTPYSSGDRMMLSQQGAGWMVEGSPQRLLRDYNQLIEAYHARI